MNNKIKAAFVGLAILSASPTILSAKTLASADTAAPPMAVDTPSFVKVVTSSNEFEIESSKLAEQKASDAAVKSFAKMMISDHTEAAEGLKKAANLGETAPIMLPKHVAMIKLLTDASGTDFESLYIDMQTSAHMEAVTLFATYAKAGDNVAIRAFAHKALPKLETHKMHVLKLVTLH